jgi:hypothetical protein
MFSAVGKHRASARSNAQKQILARLGDALSNGGRPFSAVSLAPKKPTGWDKAKSVLGTIWGGGNLNMGAQQVSRPPPSTFYGGHPVRARENVRVNVTGFGGTGTGNAIKYSANYNPSGIAYASAIANREGNGPASTGATTYNPLMSGNRYNPYMNLE